MLIQAALAEGRVHRIEIKGVAFAPAEVTVHAGDTVEWANGDIVAHTATAKNGGFDVTVPSGQSKGVVMPRPGTFSYICRYHPNMKGQVVVDP